MDFNYGRLLWDVLEEIMREMKGIEGYVMQEQV